MTDKPASETLDKVICPNCVHQFRAIPEDVQHTLHAAEQRAEQAERQLAEARACIRGFVGFRVESVFDHKGTYSTRKMAELSAIKEKHAAAIDAAREGK